MMQGLPAFLIYFIIPLLGFGIFLWLRQRMLKGGADLYLLIEYFLLFATYGGLLQVVLTALFWYGSGLASLGIFYLLFGASVLMGVIAYRNSKRKKESIYHFWAWRMAILYFLIAPIILFLLYLLDNTI